FFSSRRRHTRSKRDWSSDVCSSDLVLLTGTIYTSRDAGHKRMCEALAKGEDIPFDPKDATIYYVGPTPAKPGQVIGSAGPTTSEIGRASCRERVKKRVEDDVVEEWR